MQRKWLTRINLSHVIKFYINRFLINIDMTGSQFLLVVEDGVSQ